MIQGKICLGSIVSSAVLIIAVIVPFAKAIDCVLECETEPLDPMPIPTNFITPSSAYYEEPFSASWDHVWTGCGGYEIEFRRVGEESWKSRKVASGSSTDVVIRLPDGDVIIPTLFELRVRAYWGEGCDERVYSDYSELEITQMECGTLHCETGPLDPMPVPTSFTNPAEACFGEPFNTSWSHVWTGCGGYEFEYSPSGLNEWTTIKVGSGSNAEIVIRRPDGPISNPTMYDLRVRSYWGVGCDLRVYSDCSSLEGVAMYCSPPVNATGSTWTAIKTLY